MVAWFAAVVLLIIVALASWKVFLFLLLPLAVVLTVVMRRVIRRDRARSSALAAYEANQRALRLHADEQHRAYLAGDLDTATYGEFRPVKFVCDHTLCGGTCKPPEPEEDMRISALPPDQCKCGYC